MLLLTQILAGQHGTVLAAMFHAILVRRQLIVLAAITVAPLRVRFVLIRIFLPVDYLAVETDQYLNWAMRCKIPKRGMKFAGNRIHGLIDVSCLLGNRGFRAASSYACSHDVSFGTSENSVTAYIVRNLVGRFECLGHHDIMFAATVCLMRLSSFQQPHAWHHDYSHAVFDIALSILAVACILAWQHDTMLAALLCYARYMKRERHIGSEVENGSK
ncbi:hypothetical protein Tco_1360508 [Tanacetum coccineum]